MAIPWRCPANRHIPPWAARIKLRFFRAARIKLRAKTQVTMYNVRYLRTGSPHDVLVLSGIIQIHVFMSIPNKTGAFKVPQVPGYCLFAPKHINRLCGHMYMQQVGPLCEMLGSVPGPLWSFGAPIGPLGCPRAGPGVPRLRRSGVRGGTSDSL